MKRLILLGLVSGSVMLAGCARQPAVVGTAPAQPAAEAQPLAAERFPLPADKAGQALARTLRPGSDAAALSDAPAAHRLLPAPRDVNHPQPPLPASRGDIVRFPLGHAPVRLLPHSLPEAPPLTGSRNEVQPPVQLVLPFAAGVRVAAADVNQPIPLPTLAQPLPDRAPLDDPTVEASTQAALSAMPPPRATPAPFVKLNLPDPFEHREAVRVRTRPAEDPATATAAPPPPRPLPRSWRRARKQANRPKDQGKGHDHADDGQHRCRHHRHRQQEPKHDPDRGQHHPQRQIDSRPGHSNQPVRQQSRRT
jgi:hypothetical protein